MLVNRLPGPSTISSASAMAASASSDALTPSGVTQTRSIPVVRMICDWPSTTDPSSSRAWSVSGVGDTGRTWPRTARIRFISRIPSSKSPPSTAVIAAISRLPRACPPRPCPSTAGLALRCREAVLEDLAHERLRVRERDDAVADVADGRDPELLAQHAGRATVVGDGHDRGQVAGVLLEPAQQRRQARPATDGHDPRPAREEPLLVDELDQWLVRIVRAQGSGQDLDRLVRPERDEADPDRRRDEPAQRERQELQRQQVDERAGEPGRCRDRG